MISVVWRAFNTCSVPTNHFLNDKINEENQYNIFLFISACSRIDETYMYTKIQMYMYTKIQMYMYSTSVTYERPIPRSK